MSEEKGKAKKTPGAGGPVTAKRVQELLVGLLAKRMNTPPSSIDPKAPLASYGLDSLESVSMMVDLEKELGRRVDPTVLWQHPHIAALAERLAKDSQSPPPARK